MVSSRLVVVPLPFQAVEVKEQAVEVEEHAGEADTGIMFEAERAATEEARPEQTGRMRASTVRTWLHELDNQLHACPFNASGLARFRVPEDWTTTRGGDCLKWPC